MPKVRYVTRLDVVPDLPQYLLPELQPAANRFGFRANTYYLGLIDWSDPDDPIRKIVIPDPAETSAFGSLDASCESRYVVAPGLEHKYPNTATLLVSPRCAGFCRFCFRKRLFMEASQEVGLDVLPALAYIRRHPEVTNVLMTGGDPLMLSTRRLDFILGQLREIEHVRIIRLGSKMPAFNPFRITEDPVLLETLQRYSLPDRRIYVMAHFNHHAELTSHALDAIDALTRAGVIVCNQTPILKGINDDPRVLSTLFDRLSEAGAVPYYVFLVRPTTGNYPFIVPVERAYSIFEAARSGCSGLGKRARLVMSHTEGKVEVIAVDTELIYLKFIRAADPANVGRLMAFRRRPHAIWFDDYINPLFDWNLEQDLVRLTGSVPESN